MQASTAGQASESRRERVAAARLSELAAEARAGQNATTLERLIVKGLTCYCHGIDNEARRALAAAEPPLTGTVWDAGLAATVEHACMTHGAEVPAWTQAAERFLKRPSVYRRGPTERAAALEHEPAYPAETLGCLMQETDGEDEATSMFEDVTGKPLKPGPRRPARAGT